MTGEIWRGVPSVEGLLVSNMGRVMVIPFQAEMPNGGLRWYGGFPHRGALADGKRRIIRWRGKTHKVHRLVAEAFHGPQPSPEMRVLHLDEDGGNNAETNLKWGTQKENLNAPGFLAYCHARTGENNPFIKGRKKKDLAS